MWLLALDTTSPHGSLALLHGDAPVETLELEGPSYAAALIPAISRLLARHQLQPSQLDLLAAANGPGSFTGVRIGLATVKALMEVNGTPAVTVGTLEAIAESPAVALSVMDAGRDQVYVRTCADGHEFEEASGDFTLRLAHQTGLALTADAALARRWPALQTVSPQLAPAVARLALAHWRRRPQLAADALTLDARYLGARWGRQ